MPEIPVQHLCSFTQQLATLVCAGVPLLQSLDTVAKGTPFKPLQDTALKLRQQIAQGMSLQEGLRQSQVFDHFYCQLVAAGEMTNSTAARGRLAGCTRTPLPAASHEVLRCGANQGE